MSELSLHGVALAGGLPGVILGGKVFRHQTHKDGFWGIVFVAIVLWSFFTYSVVFEIGILVQLGSWLKNAAGGP